MAKGNEKRTYKLTKKSVRIIEALEENTVMDKSDSVDRAVKLYWAKLKSGEMQDPMLNDTNGGDLELPGDDSSRSSGSSFLDKLRGKK